MGGGEHSPCKDATQDPTGSKRCSEILNTVIGSQDSAPTSPANSTRRNAHSTHAQHTGTHLINPWKYLQRRTAERAGVTSFSGKALTRWVSDSNAGPGVEGRSSENQAWDRQAQGLPPQESARDEGPLPRSISNPLPTTDRTKTCCTLWSLSTNATANPVTADWEKRTR